MLHLQHLGTHLLVAVLVAALAAGCRNEDAAGNLGRTAIKLYGSALDVKDTMHLVSGSGEHETNTARDGIGGEGLLLGEAV